MPLGVVVFTVLLVLLQAGSRSRAPLITNNPKAPHIFLDFLPLTAAPRKTNPSIGTESHNA